MENKKHLVERIPIDFDKSLEYVDDWHKQWCCSRYGSDSLNPELYYKISTDGRYLYGYGVKEGESLNEKKATIDRVLELLLRLRLINQKLNGKGLLQHLQWKEREQLKREREGLYKEFLDVVQADFESLNPEPQQMELKDLLPKKLKADEAVEVFQNAIDAQLITNSPEGLKWNDTKQLLAYFATKVSDKFNLTTKLDKDGNKTTDWKTFETLFEQKGLKGAKQNWMRLNTKFEPTGFEKVDALF